MERTKVIFDIETVPQSIRPWIRGAVFFDSSCSENARTLLVSGKDQAFLKICRRGTLEREYRITQFLHKSGVAPKAIAFESDETQDYLLTEAVKGEDGTAAHHLEQPAKLAEVFGEYLRRC
jgi:kanamycin kinase